MTLHDSRSHAYLSDFVGELPGPTFRATLPWHGRLIEILTDIEFDEILAHGIDASAPSPSQVLSYRATSGDERLFIATANHAWSGWTSMLPEENHGPEDLSFTIARPVVPGSLSYAPASYRLTIDAQEGAPRIGLQTPSGNVVSRPLEPIAEQLRTYLTAFGAMRAILD